MPSSGHDRESQPLWCFSDLYILGFMNILAVMREFDSNRVGVYYSHITLLFYYHVSHQSNCIVIQRYCVNDTVQYIAVFNF